MLTYLFANKTTKQLVNNAFLSKATKKAGPAIIFSLLSFQAILEKASMGSKALKKKNIMLYKTLRMYDMDLFWFLVEPYIEELMFIASVALGLKKTK